LVADELLEKLKREGRAEVTISAQRRLTRTWRLTTGSLVQNHHKVCAQLNDLRRQAISAARYDFGPPLAARARGVVAGRPRARLCLDRGPAAGFQRDGKGAAFCEKAALS
jgi:hypothetical protein